MTGAPTTRPAARDGLLVALLLAADAAISLDYSRVVEAHGAAAGRALVVYAAAGYVCLLWRRRFPLVVFALTLVHATAGAVVSYRPVLAVAAALYTVAARRTAVESRLCLALVALPALRAVQAELAETATATRWSAVSVITAVYVVLFTAVVFLGQRAGTDRATVARLEAQRAAAERAAVERERRRLGRELHDIVSHTVSLITLQAAAGRRVLQEEPDGVAEGISTLTFIESKGREAMAELRRLLDVMRDRGDALPDEHILHRFSDLSALTSAVERAGLGVAVETAGEPCRLDPSIDLTAYRVVQESLTNAAKHAGPGSSVTVGIDWGDHLVIDVTDTGAVPGGRREADASPSTGTGLAGMGERVRAVGGRLHAGPTGSGAGFHVHAELPVAAPPRPAPAPGPPEAGP